MTFPQETSPQETSSRWKYPLFSDFPQYTEDRQLSLEESRHLKKLASSEEAMVKVLGEKMDVLEWQNNRLEKDVQKLKDELYILSNDEMVTIYKYEEASPKNNEIATNQMDTSNGLTPPRLPALESSKYGDVEIRPVETVSVAVGTEEDFPLPTPPETRSVGVNTDSEMTFLTSRASPETVSIGIGTGDDFTLMRPVTPKESRDVACGTDSESNLTARPETQNVTVSTDANWILPVSGPSTSSDTQQVAVNMDETEPNGGLKRESPEMQPCRNIQKKMGKRGSGRGAGGIKRKRKLSSDGNRDSTGEPSLMMNKRKRLHRELSGLLKDDEYYLAVSVNLDWDMDDERRTTRSRSSHRGGNGGRNSRTA